MTPGTVTGLQRELGLRDLVLFNIAAIISTRWVGVAAHVGPGTLVLWLVAAAFFLIPTAFVAADLSRRFPEEGGLYVWTREAFGEWHGFACAWFYYVNNLFWIPGVLVSMVGMIMYAFDARLAKISEDPRYVVPLAFLLLIGIIAANYVGLRVAKWVDNFGGSAAYVISGILVIAAAGAVFARGSATAFRLTPQFNSDKLNYLSQLAFGMTGLELSPILSGEIRDAKRTIFRATWISAMLVVLFYVVATSAILVLLPPDQVSPVIGLSQASQEASRALGWSWVPFSVAVCITLSVGGQLGTYVGACARLPFVLGIGNLLPPAFAKLHARYHTPYISILYLGVGTAILLVISQLGETFRGAYQVMVDMTVISLFIPFLYIFGAAWKFGQRLAPLSGLCISVLAIAFSFVPTADVKSRWAFEMKLIGGCLGLLILARFLYKHYQGQARELP